MELNTYKLEYVLKMSGIFLALWHKIESYCRYKQGGRRDFFILLNLYLSVLLNSGCATKVVMQGRVLRNVLLGGLIIEHSVYLHKLRHL